MNNPRKLAQLIKEHILTPADPKILKWKKLDQYPSGLSCQPCKREEYDEFEADEESKTEQNSSQTIYGSSGREDLQRPADIKIDQLLANGGQLVQVLQNQGNAVMAPARRQRAVSENDSLGEKVPNRYIRVIQNQLIKKIRMRQADEELWDVFRDLI